MQKEKDLAVVKVQRNVGEIDMSWSSSIGKAVWSVVDAGATNGVLWVRILNEEVADRQYGCVTEVTYQLINRGSKNGSAILLLRPVPRSIIG